MSASIRITPEEKRTFDLACDLWQYCDDDIPILKDAYRRDPESSARHYRAVLSELTGDWRGEMAEGINERMHECIANEPEVAKLMRLDALTYTPSQQSITFRQNGTKYK